MGKNFSGVEVFFISALAFVFGIIFMLFSTMHDVDLGVVHDKDCQFFVERAALDTIPLTLDMAGHCKVGF